ncbi:MAG TPA: nucleotidyl transferase AbiEii/AbiGii toxin family protein [Solirubrobacteraceae bacterium]|nr:nucleotidyl transferase AbiEii/AbiGii toxin family protein [Solirubrobacteraceae bacterium]
MASQPDYHPAALVQALVDGGVDFVIVGGVAVVLQAMPRFTKDLDICYGTAQDNLDALGRVLVGLAARLRGIPATVPFVPDGRSLRQTQMLCLTTPAGDIDLLVDPEGSPGYETLRERASVMELSGRSVRVASIADMLAMKRAAGRPQDLIDIESLEVARELGSRPRSRSN